nr:hypothetical protein [Paraburkholderia terrae]MDW3658557.1 hypothetical protein [Paraburkholderia terrae]
MRPIIMAPTFEDHPVTAADVFDGVRDEILLGGEMAIEGAPRHASRLYHFGHR